MELAKSVRQFERSSSFSALDCLSPSLHGVSKLILGVICSEVCLFFNALFGFIYPSVQLHLC